MLSVSLCPRQGRQTAKKQIYCLPFREDPYPFLCGLALGHESLVQHRLHFAPQHSPSVLSGRCLQLGQENESGLFSSEQLYTYLS